MKKIVIVNNKGGVGKTTVVSQLAFSLSHAGFSVIALDLDSQRNLSSVMRQVEKVGSALEMINTGHAPQIVGKAGKVLLIESNEDIPVSTDDILLQRSAQAISALKGADFCIIDTPPTFSAVVYGALLAADFMLTPVELKKFSLDGIEGVLKAFVQVKKINDDLEFMGLLPSRFDAVKKAERETMREIIDSYANLIIPHAIRNRTAYEQAGAEGVPVTAIQTSSGKEAAVEFKSFFEWFLAAVNEKGNRE